LTVATAGEAVAKAAVAPGAITDASAPPTAARLRPFFIDVPLCFNCVPAGSAGSAITNAAATTGV
jgi:hypothetical protein